MSVRRSARIAKRSTIVATSHSEFPHEHNAQCNLSNAHQAGCCYEQDKRLKFHSHYKKQQDPIEGLPMLVNLWEYADGFGDQRKRKLCFTQYCPSCQVYWTDRLLH